MSQRHPLTTLALYWLVFLLIVVGGWCLIPTSNPMPATRPAVTVLPTVFVFVAPATPTVTPIEAVLLPTRTPGPSATRTPMPTATPTPESTRVPVQRGMR